MAAPRDPTAVVGRRIVAFLIDSILLFAISAFIWQSQASYVRIPSGTGFGNACDVLTRGEDVSQCVEIGDRAYYLSGSEAVVVWLASFALGIAVYVVLQGLTGWTPGKALLGLRTVREDGRAPGLGRAAARWILLIVDSLPCIPLVGLITAATTKGHRRVGDMAAKTFVVRAADMGQPVLVPGLTAPEGATGYGQPAAWGATPPPPGQATPGWGPPQAGPQPTPQAPTSPPGSFAPPAGPPPSSPPSSPPTSPPTSPESPSGQAATPSGWALPGGEPSPGAPSAPPSSPESPTGSPDEADDESAARSSAEPAAELPAEEEPLEAPAPAEAPATAEDAGGRDEPTGAVAAAPQAAAGGAAAAGEPQWDAARGTYIQWDAERRLWLQWNEPTRSWDPIPGQ